MSETPFGDLTPDEVLAFLRTAGEDEIRAEVRRLGVERVLASLFAGMASRFAADLGRRVGRLRFELTDGIDRHVHALDLHPGGAAVAPTPDGPRATVTVDLVRFLRLGAGALDATGLLLTRRMKVSGDVLWTARTMIGLSGR